MLRPRVVLVALALSVLPIAALTACSSAPASSGSTSSGSSGSATSSTEKIARPTDTCALLSTGEAGAAFGETITDVYSAPAGESCDYTGDPVSFSVLLSAEGLDFATSRKLLELDIDKTTPISGVGDEAAGNAKGIAFRKGDLIVHLEVTMGRDHATQAQVVAAAKTIVGHLG